VVGNNYRGSGYGELLYKDLCLVGLKKDKNNPGAIKKEKHYKFFWKCISYKR
jgi:hypothetical protein